MNDRILPLEGIRNFRDYGGYAGAEGARVMRGMLWRSGHHCEATAADLEKVHALGLAAVIDLRGDSRAKPRASQAQLRTRPRPKAFAAARRRVRR